LTKSRSIPLRRIRRRLMALQNDPARKGQLAAPKRLFGEFSRYAVAPVHTRFGAVEWFVWDAMSWEPDGTNPAVIRQASSEAEAVAGLAAH
jgi:hypothetical protein